MRKKAVLTYDPPDPSLILFGNFPSQRQIVRAIRSRDKRLAESLMRSHIERATEHVALQLVTADAGVAAEAAA